MEYLNETVGREELSRRTANIAFAGFTATAAAALSPAPAQTITVSGRPSRRAASGVSCPTGS